MCDIKVYKELLYIETFNGDIYTVDADYDVIQKLVENKFINLWNELLNTSAIRRIFKKEVDDLDNHILNIQDKKIRDEVKRVVKERKEQWLRVNIGIVDNIVNRLLDK